MQIREKEPATKFIMAGYYNMDSSEGHRYERGESLAHWMLEIGR